MKYDTLTMIAAVLGVFFVSVALLKNFGRKNKRGGDAAKTDSDEVKLSDPFTAPKASEAPKPQKQPVEELLSGLDPLNTESTESHFKQYSPELGPVLEQPQNDHDYQWE